MRTVIRLKVNGREREIATAPMRTLLEVLREDLRLTGTKQGCGEGECGTCTVLVDGAAINACLMLAVEAVGHEVTTIEGLADGTTLHPLQQAFIDKGGFQCGYCTPGMIMSAYGLLLRQSHPSREAVIGALEGNLCRCSAYKRILEAVESVAQAEGGRR